MEVTYLGHAAILVRAGGTSLVMDPWLEEPTYCNSWFHYPPLALKIRDLQPVEWIWCSHEHPDHYDPATLRQVPKNQKFLVPQFASGRLDRKLRELGFTNLVPMQFGEELVLGPDLRVRCIRTDLVWEDSALIVQGGGVTLFNMNDCKLGDDLLRTLGEQYAPDIAFVPFSGAIHYPTCYDYPRAQLIELCRKRRRGHLEQFAHRVGLLRAKHAVPFAGNFALLHRDQLWMNEPELNNINTPDEAIVCLAELQPQIKGLQMNPGDRWTRSGGLRRLTPAPDFTRKMEHLTALAEAVGPELDRLRAAEAPARPGLRRDVVRVFGGIAQRHPELNQRINARIVLDAQGLHGGMWRLDFLPSGFAVTDFEAGQPWNLRMTLPAGMLQRALDDEISWDDLAISFRMRFAENPEFFNKDFWVMLYSSDPEFLGPYLANPHPKF